jgi:hypothetical protein
MRYRLQINSIAGVRAEQSVHGTSFQDGMTAHMPNSPCRYKVLFRRKLCA